MDFTKTWLYHQSDNRDHLLAAKKRLRIVKKEIDKLPRIKRILDIGFGDGFLLKILSDKYDVYGIDFIEENISMTQKSTGLGDRLKFGNISKIPFEDNYFDLVISTEMFEHLSEKEMESGLEEIKRVLKQNGYLIATTPYNEDLCKKTTCCPNCGCKFHIWGHQQSFNDSNLKSKFGEKFYFVKTKKLINVACLNFFGYIELLGKLIFRKYKRYLIILRVKK
jgi:SAM-dependent methyltransferase